MREALSSNETNFWRNTIDEELIALEMLCSWLFVDQLKDKKVLFLKLVLRKKRKCDGSVENYKAQFVVCGNEDRSFYENSFAPVINFTSMKLFVRIALQMGWTVNQLYFRYAFPQRDIGPEV